MAWVCVCCGRGGGEIFLLDQQVSLFPLLEITDWSCALLGFKVFGANPRS